VEILKALTLTPVDKPARCGEIRTPGRSHRGESGGNGSFSKNVEIGSSNLTRAHCIDEVGLGNDGTT